MKLAYARTGGIGWITLSNPPWNALTHPIFADVRELRDSLRAPDLKCAIVKGDGRHFSSGADLDGLRALQSEPEKAREWMNGGKKLLETLSYATVPIAAAIRGSCLGAGFEIALACHFRFASAHAMLGFPETEQGIMPGFGASAFAAAHHGVIARSSVIDLILSGRMVRAEEALALGLVDRVFPTGEVEDACVSFLDGLTARRSPGLIRAVMASVHNGRRLPLREALRRETELFCKVIRGDA